MDESPEALIEKYQSKGILVDTNLLLLLTIGLYNRDRIGTFKRTFKYTERDFELVVGIANRCHRRLTTPNILTETDNLARQLPRNEHRAVAAVLSRLTTELFEQYEPSANVTRHAEFPRLGLTDCVTLSAAHDVLVVTDDFRLSNILAGASRAVININHLRTFD